MSPLLNFLSCRMATPEHTRRRQAFVGSPLENSTIYLEGLARRNNSIVIKPRVMVYPKGISRSPLSPVVPEIIKKLVPFLQTVKKPVPLLAGAFSTSCRP